jgi:predicted XRE-type DNA-binding protein
MLDNDANLPEANEDKVDEKLHENEVQSETYVTEPKESTEDEGQESPDTPQEEEAAESESIVEEKEPANTVKEDENYDDITLDQLLNILEKKVNAGKVIQHRKDFDTLSKLIERKLDQQLKSKKEDFVNSGGAPEDFYVKLPEKVTFDQLVRKFKSEKSRYYQDLEKSQQNNLALRKSLIEELKGLIGVDRPISEIYKQFKDLQARWRESGHVPQSEANNIWKTYHHHVGIFYDFLHLNREFRELDYKYNYEEKIKIIEEVEAMAKMDNIQKAFRNLQELHKRWKDELGPVAKEHEESLWERFSQATKVIHEKRQFFQKNQTEIFKANFEKKADLIAQMRELNEAEVKTHNEMQKLIRNMEALRTSFFDFGSVSRSKSAEIWAAFKEVMRTFSRKRNSFYKSLKKEYAENMKKRMELVKQVEELQQTEDFASSTPKVITLQKQWKQMGPVSRKQNDTAWNLFRKACNDYFDLLDSRKNKLSEAEQLAYDEKNKLLQTIQSEESVDRVIIDKWVEDWIAIGSVGPKKGKINNEFYTDVEHALKQSGEDKDFITEYMYKVKLKLMGDRTELVQKERSQIKQRLDKAKQQYIQLETNMEFFTKSSSENPLVAKVMKDLEKQKKIIDVLEKKLKAFKRL